jgi:hypothetical protein
LLLFRACRLFEHKFVSQDLHPLQSSAAAIIFNLQPLVSISSVTASPSPNPSPTCLCVVSEPSHLYPFSFSSRSAPHHTSADRHLPPWTWCSSHHSNHRFVPLVSFVVCISSCRNKPHSKSWSGAYFRATTVTPPPRAAGSGASATARVLVRISSSRI